MYASLVISLTQGLLNKRPIDRLGWPGLLEHPFVRESSQERLQREAALADAAANAQESRAWKGEKNAMAGDLSSYLADPQKHADSSLTRYPLITAWS